MGDSPFTVRELDGLDAASKAKAHLAGITVSQHGHYRWDIDLPDGGYVMVVRTPASGVWGVLQGYSSPISHYSGEESALGAGILLALSMAGL